MVANVRVGIITEQIHLRPVCPENRAVRPDLVYPLQSVLEEIRQLLLSLDELLLDSLAAGNLGFERPGLLLQGRNLAQPVVRRVHGAVALGWDDMGMARADVGKW